MGRNSNLSVCQMSVLNHLSGVVRASFQEIFRYWTMTAWECYERDLRPGGHPVQRTWFFFFFSLAAAAAKSLQSCRTLCDPIDGSPSGSPFPGILQARTLEWVAISLSNAWKWKVKVKSLSRVRLFTTPWTAAYQAPPSMGFSRQEYWSGVPLPSPFVFFFFFS